MSRLYHWLGPTCRHKMTVKHFANQSSNFTGGGSKSMKFGLDFRQQLSTDVEIWRSPPLIFTVGGKKCKIWPFMRCSFETKQRIAYLFQDYEHRASPNLL